MATGNSIIGSLLKRVMCLLHPGIKHDLNCGVKTVHEAIVDMWNAVIEAQNVVNKNAEDMESFSSELKVWAEAQEKKIQDAIDGANGDGSLTIGLNQLGNDVKTLLTNIGYSQLGAMVKDMLLTKELKDKLNGLQNYTLPKAKKNVLGGVMIGSGIEVGENGAISTSLERLGITFNPIDNVMTLEKNGKKYDVTLTQRSDEEVDDTPVLVWVGMGDTEYGPDGLPTHPLRLGDIAYIEPEYSNGKYSANVTQPYFVLMVPDYATLDSLVMKSDFGNLDLLSQNDFDTYPDENVSGVNHHVYVYRMASASVENPVTYEFSVKR